MPKPDDPSNDSNGKPDKPDKPAEASTAEAAKTPAAARAQAPVAAAAAADDAIALLKADHRKVEGLFSQYENAASDKDQLVRQICAELIAHTTLEEEIFYPACRRAASEEEPLDEAQVEHDSAKVLIADLMEGSNQDRFRDAKVSVLAEQIKHHVGEEEAPTRGIFARAQAAGVNTPALAAQLQKRKQALMERVDSLSPSRPVSFEITPFPTGHSKEDTMANYRGSDRDRDDRGRFMSDDDRDGRRGARYRDDDGRYRARGGRDDDDGRGWYGDPQGHSEASRRGWAERGGSESRSFRDDDDDRRYSSRGNDRERDDRGRFMSDDDRDYGSRSYDRDRDDRGRFASDDDRGYSTRGSDRDRDDQGRFVSDDDRGYRSRGGERSRDERGRFTDDDDRGYGARGADRDRDERGRFSSDDDRGGRGRGQGGWFGDSRGHAEAARRGWDERNGGRSSSARDDDDRSRGGGRDQGGWFGDSRGHAEAARRGWQDRR